MKRLNIIFGLLLLFVTACNTDNDYDTTQDETDLRSSNTVTFSQEIDGVSVLIFGKNDNNQFLYNRSISSGWSDEGKVSALLDIGYYKFLFIKSAQATTSFSPTLQPGATSFDNVKIKATADVANPGYLLPVDEIWLPSIEEANEEYEILDPAYIQDTVRRAVSQVILNIKRGYHNGTTYVPIPFKQGVDITNIIKTIDMDIIGVGESIDIYGSYGSAHKTRFTANTPTEITTDGFAVFKGPFLFPPEDGNDSQVNIVITPQDDSPFPEMRKDITGKLEKNYQLVITLWLTETYQIFDITVDTTPITDSKEGDKGIWE